MVDIAANLESVRGRIEAAAHRCGRRPDEVRLVAVSKTVDAATIDEAVAAGVGTLGESRVQEASEKIALVEADAEWHFIGPLQSNKARLAGLLFDAIESVDRMELLEKLARVADDRDEPLEVWVQVEMDSGAGLQDRSDEALALCDAAADAPSLRLAGLMAIAPYDPNPEAARPHFVELRTVRERVARARPDLPELGLSMGMSGDFEVAVEEGSTLVRIGTAIFGQR